MSNDTAIVLFDGVCVLCTGVTRFARARMKPSRLEFHPLQSDRGEQLLQRFELATDELDTFVLIEGDRCSVRSTAALRLLRYLRQPWPMFGIAIVVPRPIRDAVYRIIAARRYKWFGTCPMPPPPSATAKPKENAGTSDRAGAETQSN